MSNDTNIRNFLFSLYVSKRIPNAATFMRQTLSLSEDLQLLCRPAMEVYVGRRQEAIN